MNDTPESKHSLYRVWVKCEDDSRFCQIAERFEIRNMNIESIVPNILVQYDMFLTEAEILMLKLSFGILEIVCIVNDEDNTTIYMLE